MWRASMLVRRRVEIDEIAGAHVDRADADARRAAIDAVEVDQPLQRRVHRRDVVDS